MKKPLLNLLLIIAFLFAVCAAPLVETEAASEQPTPAPGTYKIDPDHSFVYFGAKHHIVGLVRGRFDKITGTITVAQEPAACGVDVTIDPSSISTQNSERDNDLRSPAYLDVKKFPMITYRGRGVHGLSANSWRLDGSLTIHGATQVVPITFTFKGAFSDIKPGKPARVSFHAVAGTKRADFGLGARDNAEELDPTSAGPDVDIEIDVEADQRL
jgi:polyisoprenoid-binding protein YceI